jgi:cysteinyl-tRNA synthetase
MSLRIFNSLTRQLEFFTPIEALHVRMYVCGMTVYDYCHIGHARFMLTFDVVYRWLQVLGYQVTYVRNITDIDDKIIKRALERGISIRQLTDEMVEALEDDVRALGILPPSYQPRATEYIPQMLTMIKRLQDHELAYQSEQTGDVNFAVRKFAGYGKLSGKSIEQLRSGERVAVGDGKQDPLDFVLWKSAKASEPEDAKWPSVYGLGRPGWHIECSAMSCALLGETFDIHGGGLDLQFPHHENEIAQSEGANRRRFVNYWMHNGFLNVDNVKMSKSLGNFFTIRDVLKRFDGETVRFFMLQTHYRSPFNFSDTSLEDAKNGLRRLYIALDSHDLGSVEFPIDWNQPQATRFKVAMNDDFNTPIALSVLFELASEVHKTQEKTQAQLLKLLGSTLGILQQPPKAYLQNSTSLSAISAVAVEAFILERAQAKQQRDFARADQIRHELADQGIELKDLPQGTTWVRR